MNAHSILIYTFCLFGMILIHESDGKTCERNGDNGYPLKSVTDTKTWNFVQTGQKLPRIRLRLRTNPTTWFFNATLTSNTGQLYCCHKNATYYMVVVNKDEVELSTTAMANDLWKRLHYDGKMRKTIFQLQSSGLYLTPKGKKLRLSNEPEDAMSI